MPDIHKRISELPLSFARTLSWLSLVFILLTSLGLSVLISNTARETLLTKQEEFAKVLAENLNHQIYRRFTVPTVLAYGRIALRQPVQYDRLDQVVQSVIHGLKVERLRIYDFNRQVAFSTDTADLGRTGLAPPSVEEALQGATPKFEILSTIPMWQAPFHVPLEPGTFVLRTLTPLRGDSDRAGENGSTVMGVLEITQDITDDYKSVLAFQSIIVLMCLLSSVVLFTLLLILIRRAEYMLAERMAKTRVLESELHNNEKLASMGRVVASIAHEIRNPLGIIRSSAELLLKKTDSTDTGTSRILGAIYDESRRLSQTVNDFLDYARPRQPKPEVVDVNLLLDQAMAFLEGELARHQVAVERDTSKHLYVSGDKDLLYRALYNLFINGQQAMDGPGILKIRGYRLDENTVEIDLLDSGPGFEADTLPSLLDPFFTTKDDGTGLGLPIVNSIITSHGGRLQLENAPDGGAMVRIFLPAVPDELTPAFTAESESEDEAAPSSTPDAAPQAPPENAPKVTAVALAAQPVSTADTQETAPTVTPAEDTHERQDTYSHNR